MKLDNYDMQQAKRCLPMDLIKIMESADWAQKVFVGGGYLRAIVARESINDIDVFVSSKTEAELLARKLAGRDDIVTTDNAFTVKRKTPVQVIHRWVFEKAEDVANSFDFTVCCAVISCKEGVWDSFCDDRFYTDLAAKRLVYRCPVINEDAGGSMIRVLKYYQKGYRTPLSSLAAVIARLVKGIEFRPDRTLSDEQWVAGIIRGLLIEVDPNGFHPDEE